MESFDAYIACGGPFISFVRISQIVHVRITVLGLCGERSLELLNQGVAD